jgi:hypothetical protein
MPAELMPMAAGRRQECPCCGCGIFGEFHDNGK